METKRSQIVLNRIEIIESTFRECDMTCLKNSVNICRTAELRVKDLRLCVEDLLQILGDSSVLDDMVFIILDTSSNLLKELLLGISEILGLCDFGTFSSNIEANLTSNLSLCWNILDLLVIFFKILIQNSFFGHEFVEGLPKIVPTIMMNVFEHCKSSEALYSTYFQQIGDKVTSVFKKCRELQTHYFEAISTRLQFDLTQSFQMDSLLEALDIIIDIGEIVISLDVMTMAEQWRGYSKLCEKYSEWLQDKNIHNKAITVLCKEVQNGLVSVVNEMQDAKNTSRILKSTFFMLKLIEKLCELFGDMISKNSSSILQLLTAIQEYSPPVLQHKGKDKSIVDGVHSHITVGAGPLLITMIKHQSFKQSFLNQIKKESCDASFLGELLLAVSIMKSLLQQNTSDDTRSMWMADGLEGDENSNIIAILMNKVTFCHSELLQGLKFDYMNGDMISLYDYLLIHCAALSVSCEEITSVEKAMLTHVLQDNVWGGLFAVEMWMIIARYCSVNLRFDQLTYLMETYHELNNTGMIEDSPQKAFLSYLIRNLYASLTNKLKLQTVAKFSILDYSCLWIVIRLEQLPSECSNDILKVIQQTNSTMKTVFESGHDIGVAECSKMMDLIRLTSTIPETILNDASEIASGVLLDNTLSAWQRLILSDDLRNLLSDIESAVHGSQWIDRYFVCLCDVTSILLQKFNNNQLAMISQIILSFIDNTSSCCKLSTLNLLKNMAHIEIQEDTSKNIVLNHIARLFQALLQDKETIVRLRGLEVFSYFATNTPNETVINDTVKGNRMLKESVINFCMKKSSLELKEYNTELNKYTHKCFKPSLSKKTSEDFDFGHVDDLFENSDLEDVPNKRKKLEIVSNVETINNILVNLNQNVDGLKEFKDEICNSEEFYNRLKIICDRLNDVLK